MNKITLITTHDLPILESKEKNLEKTAPAKKPSLKAMGLYSNSHFFPTFEDHSPHFGKGNPGSDSFNKKKIMFKKATLDLSTSNCPVEGNIDRRDQSQSPPFATFKSQGLTKNTLGTISSRAREVIRNSLMKRALAGTPNTKETKQSFRKKCCSCSLLGNIFFTQFNCLFKIKNVYQMQWSHLIPFDSESKIKHVIWRMKEIRNQIWKVKRQAVLPVGIGLINIVQTFKQNNWICSEKVCKQESDCTHSKIPSSHNDQQSQWPNHLREKSLKAIKASNLELAREGKGPYPFEKVWFT